MVPANQLLTMLTPLKIAIVLMLCMAYPAQGEPKRRLKRRVVFSKSSKFFFRLNGKDNVLNHTEIFAHGWTIRINYDLPETIPRRHQFFKRDVHAELDSVTDESTRGIYSCIMKYVCESIGRFRDQNCGMFCGIGQIILGSQGMEAEFFRTIGGKCDFHVNNCPLMFKDAYLSNYG